MLECPECWQKALGIDGGENDCKFCRYRPDAQDLAYRLSEGRIEDYPECAAEQTFVFVLDSDGEGEWACCSCGESGSGYDNCAKCEQMTNSDNLDDIVFCEACWSHFQAS